MILLIIRMNTVSNFQPEMPQNPDKFRLLTAILKNTYYQHSLQHCFPASKIIDQALENQKSPLSRHLKQIELNSDQQKMEGYYTCGAEEVRELTEYYKYYTQSSILHLSSFFNIMHQYREQQKACHYNRFKVLLNLSNTTQNLSSDVEKEQQAAPSFLLLQQLSITNTNGEESLVIEKLNKKLQKDFGPNRYQTLQEIDKQYIFTKKVKILPSPAKKIDKISQKYTKQSSDTTISLKKKFQKKRNNTCDAQWFTECKSSSQCKIKRKKNASMTSLFSLGKNTPITRENSLKCTRTLLDVGGNNEVQVKSKILGVKARIRQQKSELLKKVDQGKQKKVVERVGRKPRY